LYISVKTVCKYVILIVSKKIEDFNKLYNI
jgi:hypothetical protein